MQLKKDTQLWWCDTERPDFGGIELGSIYQGVMESHYRGWTGYMTGIRLVFTERQEAIEEFHRRWPDRKVVEAHIRHVWGEGELADAEIAQLYEGRD